MMGIVFLNVVLMLFFAGVWAGRDGGRFNELGRQIVQEHAEGKPSAQQVLKKYEGLFKRNGIEVNVPERRSVLVSHTPSIPI